MRIALRSGEKIYINGAVLRADRKVVVELLNEATFLLETHVLQVKDATTPLRQLYFVVQTMLMDPNSAASARKLFADLFAPLVTTFAASNELLGLEKVAECVATSRYFDALKILRSLFDVEAEILARVDPDLDKVEAA